MIHLKNAIQELDLHIFQLEECRSTLMRVMGEATGLVESPVAKFKSPRAVALAAVQTLERTAKGTGAKTKRRGRLPRKPADGTHAVTRPVAEGAASPVVLQAGKACTVAGAMKREVLKMGTFTSAQLREVMDGKYGQETFYENSSNKISGNLSYWVKTGKLVLNGETFTIGDREWFEKVEF